MPVLVALMREFHAEAGYALDPAWAAQAFERLLADPSLGCAWVAHAQGEPVGHAVLTLRYAMEHGGLSGCVDDLFVRAPFRRRGTARALLDALFDECRARGCRAVQVETGACNVAARGLYAKFGLVPHDDGRLLLAGALRGPTPSLTPCTDDSS